MALSELALCSRTALQKELGLPVDANDDSLDGTIEDASALIVEYLGRHLHRSAAIVESYSGDGSHTLLLQRRPVHSVGGVAYNGAEIGAAGYEIDDADAGSVFFLGGLINTAYGASGVSRDPVLGTDRRLYAVTYDGGYVTPGQAALPGGPYNGQPVTLPRVIQRAAVEACCFLKNNPGGDADITSESSLSYSVSYRNSAADPMNGGLPSGVTAKLRNYVDVVMG